MSNFPDIINTQIVSSDHDIFWIPADEIKDQPPRPVVVASRIFSAGSAEDTLLKKMLQACHLQEENYHVLQFRDNTSIAWHHLRDQLGVKSIILLGVLPGQLGVSAQFMPHQLSRFNDCNWIVTESAEVLVQRTEIKTHLWNYGLKPAFIDKVYG